MRMICPGCGRRIYSDGSLLNDNFLHLCNAPDRFVYEHMKSMNLHCRTTDCTCAYGHQTTGFCRKCGHNTVQVMLNAAKDGDYEISRYEVRSGYLRMFGREITDDDLQAFYELFDLLRIPCVGTFEDLFAKCDDLLGDNRRFVRRVLLEIPNA